MLQFVPHCHQQSQWSSNCTTVSPPPRRVSATAPVEIEDGGRKWEKTPPAALWRFVSIVSCDFEKSRQIGNMRTRTQIKNFLNKGAARNRCLPSSFSHCPKTLDNVCVTLLLAFLLDGGVPSKIKQMNNLRYSKLENKV